MRRILLATEGSPCSVEAVHQLAALLEGARFQLTALSVVPPAGRPDDHPQAAEHYQRAAEAAQGALDLAVLDLEAAGFPASGLVRVGDPAETIVEVAVELGAELIVLGTHGREGLALLLQGSVAERVLRRAACGVLIFPSRGKDPRPPGRDPALAGRPARPALP
jgi:universal stress protein A